MTTSILILLLAFQVKHLIADYYLQFPYMYENKGKDIGWLEPLTDHAGIHAVFTFAIVGVYGFYTFDFETISGGIALSLVFSLALFDFVTHFITDRWKATRKGGPDTSKFWQYLGIDQMIHHTIGIIIVYIVSIS